MAYSQKSKLAIVLVLLLVTSMVCATWFWYQSTSSSRKIRSIVLISIDTCRADHLGCYGFPKPTTPNIDAVAREGIRFENTISPVPLTLPAHTSMLTGTNPIYHGVHHNLGYQASPENLTLPEILKEQGYTTAAFIGAFVLDARFGLDQGFDNYNDEFEEVHLAPIINEGLQERKAFETSRLAGEWLEENRLDKFFLFLHFYDPHFDYNPPESTASQFPDDLYSGEIAYTDAAIGQVIDKLKELDLYKSSLVIITADHGEMLGEHGEKTHGFFIYRNALRVPMIFRIPGSQKVKSIAGLTSIIDIVPTVCQMLDIEIPAQVHGKDLSGYFEKGPVNDKGRYLYCETQEPTTFGGNILLGLVSPRYKYIQTTRPELYDLVDDPGETNDLSLTEPERGKMMQGRLAQLMEESVGLAGTDSQMQFDDNTAKRLRSLGYVGGSMKKDSTFDQSLPDPKDLIVLATHCENGYNLLHAEKYHEAIAEFDQAIALKPGFPNAYYNRGICYMSLKDYGRAIADFSRAIERKPDYADAYNNRGTCYRCQGDDPQAISDYARVIELAPDHSDVRKHIGLALIRVGKSREAILHLRKGLELKPDWPVVLNALAWVLATHEDENVYDAHEALKLARRACVLTNNTNPITLHTLAVAYAENGRFVQAVANSQKALDLALAADRDDQVNKLRRHIQLFEAGKTVARTE